MSADQPPPPPPPPPPPADGPHHHYRMEIAVTRRGEATVTSAAVPGPPPAFRDDDPNLAHIADDRWKALLRKFVDHQRRAGTLPDPSADADQQELLAWYLRTVQEYAKNRGHKKSSLTKHHSRVLEEEAGFVFGNNSTTSNNNSKGRVAAAAEDDAAEEEKEEAKTAQEAVEEKVEEQESDKKGKQGGASPRIRIKIPKKAAVAAPGSGVGGETGSNSHTPKDSTPKVSDPMDADCDDEGLHHNKEHVAHVKRSIGLIERLEGPIETGEGGTNDDDTPMEMEVNDEEQEALDLLPAFADEDNLPVDGITLTPAQRRGLEQSPPDPAAVALLVRRFTNLLTKQGNDSDASSAVALNEAAVLLGVPRHRLVEIVEILEGIGLVERTEGGEEEGEGRSSVQWLGAEGMREQMGEESEGSDSRRAGKRKWEDAHALREEIGKLYQEESILDAWIHRCRTIPHYTDRPFLYCKAGDIMRAAQVDKNGKNIEDSITLAIRAPPGGVVEVTDPAPTHTNPKKRRHQLSITNKTSIATLPLPPPPVADSSFDATKFKESIRNVKIDMGETFGVGGISGNPVQVYHLSGNHASEDGDAMDVDGEEHQAPIKVRKVDIQTNLKGDVIGPSGLGVGGISGLVTPGMIMNGDVRYDADTLCLRDDEGASSFFV